MSETDAPDSLQLPDPACGRPPPDVAHPRPLEAFFLAGAPACVGVAYSGGRDSSALLHETVRQATTTGVRVVAFHVHHGLSPEADDWAQHCRRECERASVASSNGPGFELRRLDPATRERAESLEAWARRGRYDALSEMARTAGAGWVLLAHHRRDQAETFLLQALRGGGVAGLAAMPDRRLDGGLVWVRPWLGNGRDEIEAYLVRHRLHGVDDRSNAETRFARNRLRASVLPALSAAFPAAERSLAASARWAAEARSLLDEVAAADLADAAPDGPLRIERWLAGTPARRSNLLRAWLRRESGRPAPATLVERLMDELPGRSLGRWQAAAGEWRLFGGRLAWSDGRIDLPAASNSTVEIRGPGRHRAPGGAGVLTVASVAAGEPGLPLEALARVELRRREGGERFQAGPGRPPRSLKKQFQAAGIAPWARDGPLIYHGRRLLYVAGLGPDARALTVSPFERPMRLDWIPSDGQPGTPDLES